MVGGDAKGRLIPLTLVPLWDPELAAEEVRLCVAKGSYAIAFTENPAKLGLPSMYTGDWDVLWSTCAETDTTVSMHIGSSSSMPTTSADAPLATAMSLYAQNAQGSLADWVLSGITYTVSDSSLIAMCSFTVMIKDSTPPITNCPPNQVIEIQGCSTKMPDYRSEVVVSDNCGPITISQSIAPGSVITNGSTYTMTMIATDGAGNMDTCTFMVRVTNNDNSVTINCIAAQNLYLSVNCSAKLPRYDSLISPTDSCRGLSQFRFEQTPDSGTIVSGTGVILVKFVAIRIAGPPGQIGNRVDSCFAQVIKIDTTTPVIACPSNVVINTDLNECTAAVNGIGALATDGCGIKSITYSISGATSANSPPTGLNCFFFSPDFINS